MPICPNCQTKKLVLHRSTVYYQCKQCAHIEYDVPHTIQFPKSFDLSKVEVTGLVSIQNECSEEGILVSSLTPVLLVHYGKTAMYVPNMGVNDLQQLSKPLFDKFHAWLPFTLTSSDLEGNSDFDTVYFRHTKTILPRYTLQDNEKLYNLLTYQHRLHEKKYHVVYTRVKTTHHTYVGEHIYQKKNLIAPCSQPFKQRRYAVSRQDTTHTIIDFATHERYTVPHLKRITSITKDYIVGWNVKHLHDETRYCPKVIRKSDGAVLFYDASGHDQGYHLIGNRYFVNKSYQDGVLDLLTGTTTSYPFQNTCLDFICDVNTLGFTNAKGRHPLHDLPNITWTGYEQETFLENYHGFIPHPHRIGRLSLYGTGGYTQHDHAILVVANVSKGLFYRSGKHLVNLKTDDTHPVDDVLLKWIQTNEQVYVFEQKPQDLYRVSVLDALKKGKHMQGLSFIGKYLHAQNERLTTRFLKQEVLFTKETIQEILYFPQKGTFEIICRVHNQLVTFETDSTLEQLDVADIA